MEVVETIYGVLLYKKLKHTSNVGNFMVSQVSSIEIGDIKIYYKSPTDKNIWSIDNGRRRSLISMSSKQKLYAKDSD